MTYDHFNFLRKKRYFRIPLYMSETSLRPAFQLPILSNPRANEVDLLSPNHRVHKEDW